jgi:hypothetical protein
MADPVNYIPEGYEQPAFRVSNNDAAGPESKEE